MLKICTFLAIAVVPFIASYPSSILDDPFQLNEGQHDFSISLLKSLEKAYPGKNQIFSPHSTYRVLLHTYLGLELYNETLKSLEENLYLGWAENESDVVNAYKTELYQRSQRNLGDGIEFESANKVYTTGEIKMKSSTEDLFANQIVMTDFSQPEARRQEINAWVEEITRNHIKDLIPNGAITPATVMVMANAAFFKGFWATQFNKENTQTATFNGATPAEVEMMTVNAKFNYGVLRTENAAFLEMPYKIDDQSVSMFVYLPRENSPTAVDDLLNKMSTKTIRQAMRGARKTEVDVRFPKMKLEGSYEMLSTFVDMGFKNLPFDRVIHKAKIDVDEEGSVAAAATAAIITRGMSPLPEEFHCDHPFVFMINDQVTQEVLFAGVYRGPGN